MEKELLSEMEDNGNVIRVYRSDTNRPPNDIMKLIAELRIREFQEKQHKKITATA